MAKAGMRRPDNSEPHGTQSNKKQKTEKNKQPEVPEIQGAGVQDVDAQPTSGY